MQRCVATPTWRHLNKISYGLLPPFDFHFDHEEVLYAQKTLRIVKRKRAFGFGEWRGKSVFFKLFFHRKYAARHAQVDSDGAHLLQRNGVKTPAVYAQGIGQDGYTRVLLFEAIPHAQNLREWWLNANERAESTHVLQRFITEIAAQHQKGILQDDQDLKNYLLADDEIYTIDGAHITQTSQALTREVSLANLAILFSHFGPRLMLQHDALLEVYAAARQWTLSTADKQDFAQCVRAQDEARWQLFLTKIQHESRDFTPLRHWHIQGMFEREFGSKALLSLLHHPKKMISAPTATVLYEDDHTQLVQISMSHPLLVHCFHGPRFKRGAHDAAVDAWQAYHQHYFLQQSSLRPIATVTERFSFNSRAYVVLTHPPHLGREALIKQLIKP